MITTKDLNRKQQIFGCFLPDTLIPEILPILKAEGIPYDVRHWKDLTEDKTLTGPVIPMYKKYIEQARSQYEAAGYPDPYCIGILNVPFRPDAFFAFTRNSSARISTKIIKNRKKNRPDVPSSFMKPATNHI